MIILLYFIFQVLTSVVVSKNEGGNISSAETGGTQGSDTSGRGEEEASVESNESETTEASKNENENPEKEKTSDDSSEKIKGDTGSIESMASCGEKNKIKFYPWDSLIYRWRIKYKFVIFEIYFIKLHL